MTVKNPYLCFSEVQMSSKISITELEQQINTGMRRFLHTGAALRQIRDLQLYREVGYESFSTYLEERYEMSRCQAYRLIDAEQVMRNLEGIVVLPVNERQCRALVRLSPDNQRIAWQSALDHCSPCLPTAVDVEALVLVNHSCEADHLFSPVEQLELLGDVDIELSIEPIYQTPDEELESSVSHWRQEPIENSKDKTSDHYQFESKIVMSSLAPTPLVISSLSNHPRPSIVLGMCDITYSRIPPEHRHDRVGYWRNRAINAENNLNRLMLENSDLLMENRGLHLRLLAHSQVNSA
jgi:hypothetical protein